MSREGKEDLEGVGEGEEYYQNIFKFKFKNDFCLLFSPSHRALKVLFYFIYGSKFYFEASGSPVSYVAFPNLLAACLIE